MIEGVELRDLQVNEDERGRLVEIFREDWEIYDPQPQMSYYSMTYPGVVRAWHRHHRGQVDYFVCPKSSIKIAIYDDRDGSPTRGEVETYVISEQNQRAVRIPGDCWHGFKALGNKPALLINFPSKLYDYDEPDEDRIPYDTGEIPFDWEVDHH